MDVIIDYIKQYGLDFLLIINEMSPFLLLGLLFAGLLKVFLPETFIAKYLHKSNFSSSLNATLLGIPLPLCSCGVLPTGIALHKNGASKGATNAFLTSTPQTGVDSILVTYAMLGLPMAIIRPIVALVSGLLSGLVTNHLTKGEEEEERKLAKEPITCADEPQTFWEKVIEVFRYAYLTFLADIAKYLLWGLLAAAMLSVLLPDEFFTSYVGQGIWGLLLILFASMPLYVCATASVPIAAVLMAKGVSAGAVLVFLMAGPATNVAAFTLIGKSLGKKSLIAYLSTIIISALGFGLLIDAFLPKEWFSFTDTLSEGHCLTVDSTTFWLRTLSSLILLGLIIYLFIKKKMAKEEKQSLARGERMYLVPDMSCNHCKRAIEGAFGKLDVVERVEVNLAHKTLLLQGSITKEEVQTIVEELGFTFSGEQEQ